MPEDQEWRQLWASCNRAAFGDVPATRDPAGVLAALLERAPKLGDADRYGGGELAERLEARVAELLGKEAAVWMPSGTMAQQIVLRIHAERASCTSIAFHPYCHLDAHEERGYQALHGLHAVQLGRRERLLEPPDVAGLREPVAAVLLELPQRDLGGQLPDWDALVETCNAARVRGASLHLDGARLWQCGVFYARSFAEIASLFDTVYVSFYKDLGAPAGCAVAGPSDLIDEARIWQIRHGGRLFSALPYLLAAEIGLDEVLPRMPELVERSRAAGEALAGLDGVTVVPNPPQTAMFHLIVRRPLDAVNDAVFALARERSLWPGSRFVATQDPESQRCELTTTTGNLDVPVDEVVAFFQTVLQYPASRAPIV